jgi:hypothetical protein
MLFSGKSKILSCYDFNISFSNPTISIGNSLFYKDFIKKCAGFVKAGPGREPRLSAQRRIQQKHQGKAAHIAHTPP